MRRIYCTICFSACIGVALQSQFVHLGFTVHISFKTFQGFNQENAFTANANRSLCIHIAFTLLKTTILSAQ